MNIKKEKINSVKKYGDEVYYDTYVKMEKDYLANKVHLFDIKNTVS